MDEAESLGSYRFQLELYQGDEMIESFRGLVGQLSDSEELGTLLGIGLSKYKTGIRINRVLLK